MKKLCTVLLVFIPAVNYSQTWFDVGIKGGYGLNLLYNQNIINDRNFTPVLSFGNLFGAKAGFNFNEEHSVTFDFAISQFKQGFAYSVLNADSTRSYFNRSLGFSTYDFLLMYRKLKSSGYFEIGPQYSIVSKAKIIDSRTGSGDIINYLEKNYYSMVVGFGGFVMGTENLGVTLGLRLSYTLNDIISKEGQNVSFPSINIYPSYKPGNPFSALMVLEVNYDLGYLASAKCGKKTKFLMF